MRRSTVCELGTESDASRRKAGRMNASQTVRISGRLACWEIPIDAGKSDDVTFWEDRSQPGSRLVGVLSVNRRLDYVGLQLFEVREAGQVSCQEIGNVFCQGHEQITEAIGRKGLDLSDCSICGRLVNLCLELCQ